jgi:hypothetical protein
LAHAFALSRYFFTSLYIASMCTVSNHSAKCHEKWVIDLTKNLIEVTTVELASILSLSVEVGDPDEMTRE